MKLGFWASFQHHRTKVRIQIRSCLHHVIIKYQVNLCLFDRKKERLHSLVIKTYYLTNGSRPATQNSNDLNGWEWIEYNSTRFELSFVVHNLQSEKTQKVIAFVDLHYTRSTKSIDQHFTATDQQKNLSLKGTGKRIWNSGIKLKLRQSILVN